MNEALIVLVRAGGGGFAVRKLGMADSTAVESYETSADAALGADHPLALQHSGDAWTGGRCAGRRSKPPAPLFS